MNVTQYLMVGGIAITAYLIFQIPTDFLLGWGDWIKSKAGNGLFSGVSVAFLAGGFLLIQWLAMPELSNIWTDIGVGALMILVGVALASIIWFWLKVYRKNG